MQTKNVTRNYTPIPRLTITPQWRSERALWIAFLAGFCAGAGFLALCGWKP